MAATRMIASKVLSTSENILKCVEVMRLKKVR